MMNNRRKIFISLLLVFMIFPVYAYVAKGVLSDEAQMCLGCHSSKDLTKQLDDKEILALYINGDEFADSIHNVIGCAGCHMDISMENHPVRKIKSKKEYTANASIVCTMCHTDDQLRKKPMHGYLITKAKTLACVECHGSHYIKSISDWKKGVNETQYCLTCHKYDLSMALKSGELLSLSINESAYKNSVHGNLQCGYCHIGFSKTEHPMRTFKSKKEYTANTSKVCALCHPDSQLKKKPMHGYLITKTKAPTCVECHDSHTIKRIVEWKARLDESRYCLTCHKHDLSISLKSGELLSLYVDESVIRKSVHRNLQCHNCHSGFSKSEHPVGVLKSKREHSIVTGDVCKKCHSKAYTQYEGSIHLTMLKSGDLKAPTCTDCHGAHSIVKATADKTVGLLSCNKCHGEINVAYERSVHSAARNKGDEKAPVCSSCHNAHDVKVTAMTMKMKDVCLECHKDAQNAHKKWLWNPPIALSSFAGLHFDVIACATCHSSDAGRGIYLILYDKKTGKPFPEEEVLKLLETDTAGLIGKIDSNGDSSINASELWNMVKQLNGKGTDVTFTGRMDVRKGTEAHQLAAKTKAVKECEQCHRADSDFFKEVSIVLTKTDGRPTLLNAKQEVLGSIFSVLPVSKFYVLGSTNLKLLDILFIIAVLGGLAVPVGHITLRIVTTPLRTLRRMGKGGKK
ncbi:MAG: cytochrome c3 family protein [Nitrospirota bacterium]